MNPLLQRCVQLHAWYCVLCMRDWRALPQLLTLLTTLCAWQDAGSNWRQKPAIHTFMRVLPRQRVSASVGFFALALHPTACGGKCHLQYVTCIMYSCHRFVPSVPRCSPLYIQCAGTGQGMDGCISQVCLLKCSVCDGERGGGSAGTGRAGFDSGQQGRPPGGSALAG